MTHKKDENIIDNNKIKEDGSVYDFDNIEDDLQEEIKKAEDKEQEESNKNWAVFLEIDKLKKEVDALKLALARSQADYQNLLMRVERDKSEMSVFILKNLLLKILPFIDNLERLILNTPEDLKNNSLYEWIKSVYDLFIKQLNSIWINSYESIGSLVDVNLHEVVGQWKWEEWIIIQVLEKGYKLEDKILRYAKVIVWNWSTEDNIKKE
jgi:molecular chaperone GrpE